MGRAASDSHTLPLIDRPTLSLADTAMEARGWESGTLEIQLDGQAIGFLRRTGSAWQWSQFNTYPTRVSGSTPRLECAMRSCYEAWCSWLHRDERPVRIVTDLPGT